MGEVAEASALLLVLVVQLVHSLVTAAGGKSFIFSPFGSFFGGILNGVLPSRLGKRFVVQVSS